MVRIDDFLSKGSRKDRVEQFRELSEGKSKEEKRALELNMLKPEPVPNYHGEEMRFIANSEFSVRFVFASQEDMDLFGRHIPIASYQDKCVTKMDMVLNLLRAMDRGEVLYDKKTGKFSLPGKSDTTSPERASKGSASEAERSQEERNEKVEGHPSVRKLFRR